MATLPFHITTLISPNLFAERPGGNRNPASEKWLGEGEGHPCLFHNTAPGFCPLRSVLPRRHAPLFCVCVRPEHARQSLQRTSEDAAIGPRHPLTHVSPLLHTLASAERPAGNQDPAFEKWLGEGEATPAFSQHHTNLSKSLPAGCPVGNHPPAC